MSRQGERDKPYKQQGVFTCNKTKSERLVTDPIPRRNRRIYMKKTLLMLWICLALPASSLASETNMSVIDFDSSQETEQWWPVNDGVMGGRSSGGPTFEDGHMIFSGIINTNGGGFSSLRRQLSTGDLKDVQSVKLRLKSDGRAYKLRFRTNVTWRGRRIAFQKEIPASKTGEWETVTLTLDNMKASLFGRRLRGAKFVPGDAIETGVIIADGQDGPFRLEIDWMKFE